MQYLLIFIIFNISALDVRVVFADSNDSILVTSMVVIPGHNQHLPIIISNANSRGFKILEDTKKRNIKRSVTVRLDHKVSKKTLIQIAKRIKGMDKKQYQRTFILYYLPGMKIGMGAWATTHFNPGLKVVVQGMSLEDEKALTSKKKNNRRDEIGSWKSETFPAGIITIYKKKGAFFLEHRFTDGSKMEKKVIRKSSSNGVRFLIENSSSGDYYLIDKSKNLQVWDNLGLISTMIRVSK